MLKKFCLLLILLTIPILSGFAESKPPRQFDPLTDGFSFQNYGTQICTQDSCSAAINLTTKEVWRLFGDAVCRVIENDACVLRKAAQVWMADVNQAMSNGHCEGLAILSALFYAGLQSPHVFGSETVFGLNPHGNDLLQREIAYWFSTQWLEDYEIIEADPHTQVETLKKYFADTPSMLIPIGFFLAGQMDGHTVTAFSVQEPQIGRAEILVYDNNFPGETHTITVDLESNSWRYETLNVLDGEKTLYEGSGDKNPLQLFPLETRLGIQNCYFCPEYAKDKFSIPINVIRTPPNMNIFVERSDGSASGFNWETGLTLDEISGVKVLHSPQNSILKIPADLRYMVWLNSPDAEKWMAFDVTFTSPGMVLSLKNVLESYDYPNFIYSPPAYDHAIDAQSEKFEITAYPAFLPDVELVITDENQDEIDFNLKIIFTGSSDTDAQISLVIFHDYENGEIGFMITPTDTPQNSDLKGTSFIIEADFSYYQASGESKVSTDTSGAIELLPSGMFYINYWQWRNGEGLWVIADQNGDGNFESKWEMTRK